MDVFEQFIRGPFYQVWHDKVTRCEIVYDDRFGDRIQRMMNTEQGRAEIMKMYYQLMGVRPKL